MTAPNEYINHKENDNLISYISDWNKERVRFSYEFNKKRNEIINSAVEKDILEKGTAVTNLILGDVLSRSELSEELSRLLECM